MDSRKIEAIEKDEMETENAIFRSVIESYWEKLMEIRESYKLLIKIITVFAKIFPDVPDNLNSSYVQLFDQIKHNIDLIEVKINKQYEKDEKDDNDLPSSYIHPHLFKNDHYRPFRNLFTAQTELETQNLSWKNIYKKMYNYIGNIDDVVSQIKQEKTPQQNSLCKKVEKILKRYEEDVDIESYFSFDDMTFKLTTVNNDVAPISFHPTRNGTTNPYCLMKAFVEHIKEYGKRNGGYLETVVPKQYIFEYIEKKFPNTVKDNQEQWLKTTKGNLIKKIADEYLSLIIFKDFDSKNKGYPFSLKLPILTASTPELHLV